MASEISNNENSKISDDTFNTNSNSNVLDGKSNIVSLETPAASNMAGGSLYGKSLSGASSVDVSLKDFLSRPLLLYSTSIDGSVASIAFKTFAYDYLSNASVIEKLKYHNLVRGTFQIKVIITSPPFATGAVVMSSMYETPYLYSYNTNDITALRYMLTQKTHVMCDLGLTNSMTLNVPFHHNTPYVMNSDPDITELRKMLVAIYNLTAIKNTQQNTEVLIYYKVYVSLIDAEVSVPVPVAATYTSETIEAMHGPISYPMSVLANIGHKLSDIPAIGPFATAANLAFGAAAKIARLFGFSRPRDLSKPNYPHLPWGSSGVGEVRSKNMTLDPLAEVTVDPSVFGEHGDNLSFQNILGRYGLFDIAVWDTNDVASDIIMKIPVSPTISYNFVNSTFSYIVPTPLHYGSILFQAWRGPITFKFQVPANRFVRGKLRIFWTTDPGVTVLTAFTVSNKALSVLLDLSMTTVAELTVPWLSENMYKEIQHVITKNDVSEAANGYLYLMVEEPLIVSNVNWEASVMIFVKAADGFDLAIPHTKFIQAMCFSAPNATATGNNYSLSALLPPTTGTVIPQRDVWSTYTSDGNEVNPLYETDITIFPASDDNRAQLLHTGEKMSSFRSLFKRFELYYTLPTITQNHTLIATFIPYLPRLFEYTITGTFNSQLNTSLGIFTRMFAGMRGSLRVFEMNSANSKADRITNRGFGVPPNIYYYNANTETGMFDYKWLTSYFNYGTTFFRASSEPIIVDVPFQNKHWFYPTISKLDDDRNGVLSYGVFFREMTYDNILLPRDYYIAAGEDFQLVIYNGPPIYALYVPPYPVSAPT